MEKFDLSILVVDDEISITNSISEYLNKMGFKTYISYTAEEAIVVFQKNIPNVCILDINLPGLSGIDLLKIIKDHELNTQIVMLTGYGSVKNITDALRYGACDFLQKPINFDILLHAIDNCFNKYELVRMKEDYKIYLENEVSKKTKQNKLKRDYTRPFEH